MKLEELGTGQRLLTIIAVVTTISVVLLLVAEGIVRVRSYVKTGFWWGVDENLYDGRGNGFASSEGRTRHGSYTDQRSRFPRTRIGR